MNNSYKTLGRLLAGLPLYISLWMPLALHLGLPSHVLGQDGGMEEFEEVDPYTNGEREKLKDLGYVTYAPFQWSGAEQTTSVTETMGKPPILWVETEHFRIGSTLGSYKPGADRVEKAKIKEECARLKKKLGKLKVPKKKIDPWLRLHLYAQRAEDIYAAVHKDFGLKEADYSEKGEFLGLEHKFLILLCQRKSELGRYLRATYNTDPQPSWRWGTGHDGGIFYGVNMEDLKSGWSASGDDIPFDTLLHGRLISGVTANLMDNYRRNAYSAPRWLVYGLSHRYVRAMDARWISAAGGTGGGSQSDDSWEWSPRVMNLVKNDFFASASEMFGWIEYDELNPRDHMVSWSKLEYLLDECKGDHAAFLGAVCILQSKDPKERQATQTDALQTYFKLTPDDFDSAWAKWVKKVYKKR